MNTVETQTNNIKKWGNKKISEKKKQGNHVKALNNTKGVKWKEK